MAASERYDTKEWRSPFDTNPTFDTDDLVKIERSLAEKEPTEETAGVKKSLIMRDPDAVREHDRSTRKRQTEMRSKWAEVDALYSPADESPKKDQSDVAAAMKYAASPTSASGG